ncbi:hypothetical protein GDO78_022038 [Eleutherodactylus coqui]|uniref:Secreted protein n=1 Tax=Eleutherodactylus coqui TaxID=57060 RepID=A0A8J6C4Z4_ELECQ|nr:hypothetical protein GDO78_022038 [Eleutherodactylus coqui]
MHPTAVGVFLAYAALFPVSGSADCPRRPSQLPFGNLEPEGIILKRKRSFKTTCYPPSKQEGDPFLCIPRGWKRLLSWCEDNRPVLLNPDILNVLLNRLNVLVPWKSTLVTTP